MNPDYPKDYRQACAEGRGCVPKKRYLLIHDSCEEAGIWKIVFEVFGGNTVAIRRYENDELNSTSSKSTEEARELWNESIHRGFRFPLGREQTL